MSSRNAFSPSTIDSLTKGSLSDPSTLGLSIKLLRNREPVIRVATQWLEENAPDCDRIAVVHGDFRTGNYLFDEETDKITALLDWEICYLGGYHADLAWLLQLEFGTHIDGIFRVSDIFEGKVISSRPMKLQAEIPSPGRSSIIQGLQFLEKLP